jgi:hypothetical protein
MSQLACTKCNALLRLPGTIAAGRKVRCPRCQTILTVPAADDFEIVDDDSPEPAPPPRRRLKKKKKSNATNQIVTGVAAVLSLVIIVGLALFLIPKFARARPPEPQGTGTNINQYALEITGKDTDGVPFKLSDYRGKVVVLDFWGDW